MSADPARATLLRAQADSSARVDIATNGVVRTTSGGCGWNDERTRAHRAALAMALTEHEAVTRALAMLDKIDAETSR